MSGDVAEPFQRVAIGRINLDDVVQQLRCRVEPTGLKVLLRRFEERGNR